MRWGSGGASLRACSCAWASRLRYAVSRSQAESWRLSSSRPKIFVRRYATPRACAYSVSYRRSRGKLPCTRSSRGSPADRR